MKSDFEENFVGRVAQKVIISNKGNILVTHGINDAGLWELPGGHLNVEESAHEGLSREVFEELGLDIEIGALVYSEQFIHPSYNARALLLVFEASLKEGSNQITLDTGELSEYRWISKEQIDEQPFHPEYKRALDKYFSNNVEL